MKIRTRIYLKEVSALEERVDFKSFSTKTSRRMNNEKVAFYIQQNILRFLQGYKKALSVD